MRQTLYPKILAGYLAFALLAVFLLSTYTEKIVHDYLLKTESEKLYREATILASDFRSTFREDEISAPNLQKELQIIGGYLGSEIWLLDTHGTMLLDSSNPNVQTLATSLRPFLFTRFQVADFGNSYSQIGSFYEEFSVDTMTVYAPVTVDYKVRAYVLIHKPISGVLANSDDIVNIVFTSSTVIFFCSLIFLLSFTIFVYLPIHRTAKIAKGYAKGDFSKQIPVSSHDEIGLVASTMNLMATELETLEDEQKKFISNVSHDFRSPLTSIKGYIEAMIDGTIPPEMQEKYLNIILFETERLNKLTQSILDLNHFRGQGMMLDITDFDINAMIRTTIQTFEGTCSKKGLSFDLLLTEKQLFVKGDTGKIQQVLYNLIDNATKFSNNNSAIVIETNVKNEVVFISVKDSGIGIPSESIKKIWERFYKTDLSRGKDKRGTGLGLAIVKEIIQAHNQNINVISTEGVGTEFIFTLPLAEKEL